MLALSRRGLVFGSTALPMCSLCASRAEAAEFSYKLGTDVPPDHPTNVRALEAADRIRKASGGRMEIQIFPIGQLGSNTDKLSQLRSGALEFLAQSSLGVSTLVPSASISGLSHIFNSYEEVWRAMDGQLGNYVRAEIRKRGLLVMDKVWDNGFRQITTSTKPIVVPDDLKGLKIRVPVSPLYTSVFQAFGASPASINLQEVYTALQTKLVDAQENPLSLIQSTRLFEVQRYCSLTRHIWDGFWMLTNRRAFERLPPDLQEIVVRELNTSALAERADLAKSNVEGRTSLEAAGLVFNEVDTPAFKKTLLQVGFYKAWHEKYGDEAWRVLEASVGAVS